MDFRVLQYFVTIVDFKSISNAAKALHITQPTLSRQIKELETDLDALLFHRGSREIHLTDEGQYLYNRALEILALVDKTESSLRRSEDLTGQLYLGLAESQSLDLVARAMAKMAELHPKVQLHLRSANADHIFEQLNQGGYDLGVTIGTFDEGKYDSLALPYRDQWGALVPANHPLTQLDQVQLKDCLAYPLIVSAQSNIDPKVLAGLGNYRIAATYNLLYNASLLVKAGLGVALCLDGIIDTTSESSALTFIPFAQQNQDSFQVIWKKQSSQSPIAREFLRILEEEMSK